MSNILKRIKDDLKINMKEEMNLRKQEITLGAKFNYAVAHKDVSRAIISMFPGIGKKPKDATDDDVIKLLRKYINQEKERHMYQFGYLKQSDIDGKSGPEIKKLIAATMEACSSELTSIPIVIAQNYLPAKATEEDILNYIKDNIDFSQYKNKMQAMSPIMKEFKGCDGNFVKGILMKM